MDRRTFNKVLTSGAFGLGPSSMLYAPGQSSASQPRNNSASHRPDQVYRRLLVDTHIPDWDPRLLSRFDSEDYVSTIARAGFQSLMQYAISCAGLCLWRTKIGTMHHGMRGRDYFGEVMEACKRHGLYRVAYFHVIWDNHAYETHPEWRFHPAEGDASVLKGRYGYTCPNTPYRDYALALARELVTQYEFDGIFNDMILWPGVCYCSFCTARFRKEHDAEPPRIVDWNDPLWRTFQAARERWLHEFADDFTKAVKSLRPIWVEHQFSTVFSNWTSAVPLTMGTETMDSVGGDFYGGVAQFSLACKAFDSLNRNRPFEFMTSGTDDLTDFVSIKSFEQLRTESLLPSIHSAALLTIDALNPEGTMNHKVYEVLGRINQERAAYEPFLGGKLLADVAVYYDKQSMYNPDENGIPVDKLRAIHEISHFKAVLGAARILRRAHIPFGVITNATLEQLLAYRAVILPDVLELSAEQAALFRNFVEQGGVLYASGRSSLDRLNQAGPRYLLADVFGIRYKDAKLGTRVTYLTPCDAELEKVIWPQNEVIFRGSMLQVERIAQATVLATVTLPWVDPETIHVIGSHFAQIISDPPAPSPGTDPGIVVNSYGKGKTIWVAAPIEASEHEVNAKLVVLLLRRVLPGPYKFEVETRPSVEMTLYHQPENHRLLAGLLNMQEENPPLPASAKVRVQIPSGRRAKTIMSIPGRQPLPFSLVGPYVEFEMKEFPRIAMVSVEYQ